MNEVVKCGGYLGGGVFSAGGTGSIKGIVVRDEFCSAASNPGGSFHTIADYTEWIEAASGASEIIKIHFLLFLAAFAPIVTM